MMQMMESKQFFYQRNALSSRQNDEPQNTDIDHVGLEKRSAGGNDETNEHDYTGVETEGERGIRLAKGRADI